MSGAFDKFVLPGGSAVCSYFCQLELPAEESRFDGAFSLCSRDGDLQLILTTFLFPTRELLIKIWGH